MRINYGNGDRIKKTRLCRSQISLSDIVRNLTKLEVCGQFQPERTTFTKALCFGKRRADTWLDTDELSSEMTYSLCNNWAV